MCYVTCDIRFIKILLLWLRKLNSEKCFALAMQPASGDSFPALRLQTIALSLPFSLRLFCYRSLFHGSSGRQVQGYVLRWYYSQKSRAACVSGMAAVAVMSTDLKPRKNVTA